MEHFFILERVQQALTNYLNLQDSASAEILFGKARDSITKNIITSFQLNQKYWDKNTQFNINEIGLNFIEKLEASTSSEHDKDVIFAYCFRFVLESYSFRDIEPSYNLKEMQPFAVNNLHNFSEEAACMIRYTCYSMPIEIVKRVVFNQDIGVYQDYLSKSEQAEKKEEEWKEFISNKQSKVDELHKVLEKHESAFNFVGLYAGFSKLGRIKLKELNFARYGMYILGTLIPIPLAIELVYMLTTTTSVDNLAYLIKSIPVISLTLIFIYYFRVSLNNVNSIRAQLSQIELRKSLCRFIQSYAEYSKQIKTENNNPLSKFEDIIFSNIMTSNEKIPSTFDGLEQIATLIGSLKGGKG